MSLSAAVREDHNPLGVTAPLISPLLTFLRWTTYSCPHCHSAFRRGFWPYNVRLGNGERACGKCERTFDDGAREWPQLRLAKKLRFYFPPLVLALAGGSLYCGILCCGPPRATSSTG
jgi:hypothetical protein